MKILRMTNRECKDLYVIRTEDDILWFSEPWDVIKIASNVSSQIETKVIMFIDLNTRDEVSTFNILWEDIGSVQDISDAFENLWVFANNI